MNYVFRLFRSEKEKPPKLLVFGNPLLDISVTIKDDELLLKYNLEKNGQKEVSLESLGKLIGDAKARYDKLTLCGFSSIKQAH